ncbi:hypothetical protein BOW53_13525 [Solemya pervernicosa gill symbiont]|uniref:diguanylate cyclase n=1 Tax=Solemya pervernicosa gill symbiont TaxID=642797 RepID=A0A1T2L1L8_9GAMM|nr:GGDEF domain-containing protein [Solemya pervernicosa gill symbiont]OOZ38972.1 hypothetical protein BOW53_13525 [Solemya pervernicosa gill symbiont]
MSVTTERLAQVELFKDASEALLQNIVEQGEHRTIESGELLLTPEKENHHLYLLLSGTLGLHFDAANTPEIRELEAGVAVGEMSIIDDARPSAYLIAKGKCELLAMHRDQILDTLVGDNPMTRNLLQLMSKVIKLNTKRIINDQAEILELASHANVDGLTGLYNRRWLDNALARLLEQSNDEDKSLAILLLDVDKFKNYNDTQGHQGGDCALIALGDVLKTVVRPYDFATRYGGEEFLVLLPNTDKEEALSIAERVREATERRAIAYPDGRELPSVTVSIGLAVNRPGSTPESLINSADELLYRAKEEGRNRVCS